MAQSTMDKKKLEELKKKNPPVEEEEEEEEEDDEEESQDDDESEEGDDENPQPVVARPSTGSHMNRGKAAALEKRVNKPVQSKKRKAEDSEDEEHVVVEKKPKQSGESTRPPRAPPVVFLDKHMKDILAEAHSQVDRVYNQEHTSVFTVTDDLHAKENVDTMRQCKILVTKLLSTLSAAIKTVDDELSEDEKKDAKLLDKAFTTAYNAFRTAEQDQLELKRTSNPKVKKQQ